MGYGWDNNGYTEIIRNRCHHFHGWKIPIELELSVVHFPASHAKEYGNLDSCSLYSYEVYIYMVLFIKRSGIYRNV